MKIARFALLLLALALVLPALAGCGNKGPLVHPDEAADAAAPG
jgi:predicted small lipoprotein YifL